jgi:anti-sigma regulatory factor (Ser/Thr protein kinase)
MINEALEIARWDDGIELLSALPNWVTLKLRCRAFTADRVIQFCNELKMDLPQKDREYIGTAFREMLLNAIEHGGHYDPELRVEVSYVRTSRVIIYEIRDPGKGFPIGSLPQAAVSNPSDDPIRHVVYRIEHGLRPGGFGMLITKGLVDELLYNEQGNQVMLIKFL